MFRQNKILSVIIPALVLFAATAATIAPAKNFKNLKVLPQNISDRQLDSVMDSYNRALKVSCDFCHSKALNITGLPAADGALDFAADNGMKENARKMMRLTIDLNKTHFNYDTINKKQDYMLNVVSCNTCHRGNAFPAHE